MKSAGEIMEILEAFDLTRSAWSAAELSGADAKTVQRYVGLRDTGHDPFERVPDAEQRVGGDRPNGRAMTLAQPQLRKPRRGTTRGSHTFVKPVQRAAEQLA